MGLQNSNSNLTYVRLSKDGKFRLSKDGEPFDELSGSITAIRYFDEDYQGDVKRKMVITFADADGNYQLKLNTETGAYSSLTSFLPNVDVTRPLTLVPKTQEIEGQKFPRTSMLIKQDGIFAKAYFTKATPHGLPEWTVVKVGSKKVVDKADYLSFLEDYVTKNITSKLTATPSAAPKQTGTVVQKKENSAPDLDTSFDTNDDGEEVNATPWD